MRKLGLITALVVGVFALAASTALAASPHFKRGGTPKCTISGSGTNSTSTTCTGTLAGLGGEDLVIDVTVQGSAVYTCQNNGGQIAPGQNKVLVGPTTTPTTIDSDAIKNGTLKFTTNSADLSASNTVSGSAAGCPGGEKSTWTGVNPVLTITSITLSISQGGNTFYNCTVSNPDGLTGTVSFPASC